MPVYHLSKTCNFTQVANSLINDSNLAGLEKSVAIIALASPREWNFSISFFEKRCSEGKDAICAALINLEKKGYLVRERKRVNGLFAGYEYSFFESPALKETFCSHPTKDCRVVVTPVAKPDHPAVDYPYPGNPDMELPDTEIPEVYNIINDNTVINNTSINYQSITPEEMRDRIESQLEIDNLAQDFNRSYLNDIVSIVAEVYATSSPTVNLSRDKSVSTEYAIERLSKLNALHVEQVLRTLESVQPIIRNTRGYFLTALISAVNSSNLDYAYGNES